MISYSKQLIICNSTRERIKQAIAHSDDASVRSKVNQIPTSESILRAVSLLPEIDTEEKLRDFIIEHIMRSLNFTAIQREHLNLNI